MRYGTDPGGPVLPEYMAAGLVLGGKVEILTGLEGPVLRQ